MFNVKVMWSFAVMYILMTGCDKHNIAIHHLDWTNEECLKSLHDQYNIIVATGLLMSKGVHTCL